jgi:hypothetical protein
LEVENVPEALQCSHLPPILSSWFSRTSIWNKESNAFKSVTSPATGPATDVYDSAMENETGRKSSLRWSWLTKLNPIESEAREDDI